MHSLHAYNGAITGDELRPEEGLPADLAEQLRNRQAAVVYLQAAALTHDAAARALLRWHGAELVWPRAVVRRLPRAC